MELILVIWSINRLSKEVMKVLQYIYYRLTMFYKNTFGIENPSSFFIQSCYSWGLLVLMASVCFYLLALETLVLWFFNLKMKPVYVVVTVIPFALIHIFSEQLFGDEKKRFKVLEKRYACERFKWIKGTGVLLFAILSFVSFGVALLFCK